MLLALLAAPLLLPQESEEPVARPAVVLTAGPFAERVAALDWGALGGAAAEAPLPPWDTDAWSVPEPWRAWAGLAVGAAAGDDPARGALAQLAHDQGRWDDAWAHIAAAEDDAEVARRLPAIAAGVPAALAPADGLVVPLPDGVELAPGLPPPGTFEPGPVRRERRSLDVRGLRVGGALLDLRVALEGDGVQIDVTHVAGDACTVRVRIPAPEGFEIRVEYLDWTRLEGVGLAREVRLRPGDEPHKLWGRFLRFPRPWPTTLPPEAPRQVREAGLRLVAPADGGGAALLAAFAAALSGELGILAEVALDGEPAAPDRVAPLWLHFTQPEERADKLAAVMGLVERHLGALARR